MKSTEKRLLLVADGGSTKAAWQLIAPGHEPGRIVTTGVNPSLLSPQRVSEILSAELLPTLTAQIADIGEPALLEVAFYGSGCTPLASEDMSAVLSALLKTHAEEVRFTLGSDIGWALLTAPEPGTCIVGIMGTGSNTCVAENGCITATISPGGYILGDEGSATWIGRRVAAAYLRGMLPSELSGSFEQQFSLNPQELIRHVYRPLPSEAAPNRFLGQLAPFVTANASRSSMLEQILAQAAAAFYKSYIDLYLARGEASADTPVILVGSVAAALAPLLTSEARRGNMTSPTITPDPLPAIASRHILKLT